MDPLCDVCIGVPGVCWLCYAAHPRSSAPVDCSLHLHLGWFFNEAEIVHVSVNMNLNVNLNVNVNVPEGETFLPLSFDDSIILGY